MNSFLSGLCLLLYWLGLALVIIGVVFYSLNALSSLRESRLGHVVNYWLSPEVDNE